MESEEINNDSKPNTIGNLKREYFEMSTAILNKAKDNGRLLLLTEVRILRELAIAMRHLDMIKAPDDEKERLIVIRPKLPEWLQKELRRTPEGHVTNIPE
jgi:hypothetical protein